MYTRIWVIKMTHPCPRDSISVNNYESLRGCTYTSCEQTTLDMYVCICIFVDDMRVKDICIIPVWFL